MKKFSIVIGALFLTLLLFGCSTGGERQYSFIVSTGSYEDFLLEYLTNTLQLKNNNGEIITSVPNNYYYEFDFTRDIYDKLTKDLPNKQRLKMTEIEFVNYLFNEFGFTIQFSEDVAKMVTEQSYDEGRKRYWDHSMFMYHGWGDDVLIIIQ